MSSSVLSGADVHLATPIVCRQVTAAENWGPAPPPQPDSGAQLVQPEHPSQAEMFAVCLQNAAGGRAVEVIADPHRDPGDAIFETQRGNLDASVESQLQEIERGLADRLRKQS